MGYQDGYLAFCATDPETGELTGALKDYLEDATECVMNAQLQFETRYNKLNIVSSSCVPSKTFLA